jgi:transposase
MTRVTPRNESNEETVRLYMAFELSEANWKLAFGDGGNPRLVTIESRRLDLLERELSKAKAKLGMPEDVAVVSCYEAGRDGFWLHRYLESRGVQSLVIDPASLEVNRRMRRAKTDRLDVQKIYQSLLRHDRGEKGVFSVVRVPTVAQEDERRVTREIERLQGESTAHSNRVRSLLVTQGISTVEIAKLPKVVESLRTWEGAALGENLKAELMRENERWRMAQAQLKELRKRQSLLLKEASKRERGKESPHAEKIADAVGKVLMLMTLCGVGDRSAWPLVREFLYKRFSNRREVGAAAGLVGSPFTSGTMEKEQGISKAGNKRVRRIMIELAWCWIRFQPGSEITLWFNARFAEGGKRLRRVGIVGVARRLLVALWRYVEHGVVPAGAKLKALEA